MPNTSGHTGRPCRGPHAASLQLRHQVGSVQQGGCPLTFITDSRQGTVQSLLRPALGSDMTLQANCSPLSRCVATRTVE